MYRRWIDSSEEPRRMQEWINMAVVEFEPIAPGRLLPAGTREEIAENRNTINIVSKPWRAKKLCKAGAITTMHD